MRQPGKTSIGRDAGSLVIRSLNAWMADYAPSMGAALAFYTAFSLAPLLIVVVAVAGLVFGPDAARGEIVGQLRGLIGTQGAEAVQQVLLSADQPSRGITASVVGIATLMLGATTVLAELQSALDRIWRVDTRQSTSLLWGLVRARLLSLSLILALAFLLLVSLIVSAALAALGTWGVGIFPRWEPALQLLNQSVSFLITTALFATIYRILPRVRIAWSDVWIGSVATAALFTGGKYLIGLYLGRAGTTSAFGAAGSLTVLLLWVYYSTQIFLLGAEFTWVYAHTHGSRAGLVRTGSAPHPA